MNELVHFVSPWLAIGFIALVGVGWLIALEKKFHTIIHSAMVLPTGFLLGIWGSAVLLYGLSLCSISWNRIIILTAMTASAGCGLVYGKLVFQSHLKKIKEKLALHDCRIQLAIFLVLMTALFMLLYRVELSHDLMHSDNLAYWFLRGKMYYLDHGFSLKRLNQLPFNTVIENPAGPQELPTGFIPLQYPVLVPLSVSMNHLIYNDANIINAKYLWLAIEMVLAAVLWHIGKSAFPKSRWSGLISVLLLYSVPTAIFRFSIHNFGYADIWLGTFTVVGMWFLHLALRTKNPLYLLLGGIFVSGAAICKIEGIALIYLAGVILLSIRQGQDKKAAIISSLLIMVLPLSWFIFMSQIHAQTGQFSNTFNHVQFSFTNLAIASAQYLRILFDVSNQGIVWYVFYGLMAYQLYQKKLCSLDLLLQLAPLVNLIFMIANYAVVFYPTSIIQVIKDNSSRFLLQWSPTALLFTLVTASEIWCRGRDSNPHEA